MYRGPVLLLAAVLAFAGSAAAVPAISFAPNRNSYADGDSLRSGDAGLILVQNRARGGGGGHQRSAGAANRGSFNSNDFHRNVSNAGNVNVSRNANVNTTRNVNVSGNCCSGNYNDGPTWGGVAAGVAVGAMIGAAASQPAYPPPPSTYPPGYVTPPPY